MRTLALETSGATFSVALAEDGKLIAEIFWHSALAHSERLVPAVAQLLRQAGWEPSSLDRIAVSTGPGSFTGIRVGIACARTMAQTLDMPVVGMSTLDILAAAVPAAAGTVFPAIDALRGELYVKNRRTGTPEIRSAAEILKNLAGLKTPVCIVGNAAQIHAAEIRRVLGKRAAALPSSFDNPRAGVLALLSEKKRGAAWNRIKPLYLRRSWAEERPAPKK